MNWDAVGAIAEGLGAIAVIMSVLYLAVQIRGQTKESRLAATRDLSAQSRHAMETLFQDKEMAALHRTGMHDYLALPPEHRIRVSLAWMCLVRVMEQQYLHTHHGSIDSSYVASNERSVKEFLSLPGVQTWWEYTSHSFDDDFRMHIERLLVEARATEFKTSFTIGAADGDEPAA